MKTTKNNPLLKRREIIFLVEEKSTPNRIAIRRELAKSLQTGLDQIYIRELSTKSGTRNTIGVAHIYDDPVKALEIEPRHIIERNKVTDQQIEVIDEEIVES